MRREAPNRTQCLEAWLLEAPAALAVRIHLNAPGTGAGHRDPLDLGSSDDSVALRDGAWSEMETFPPDPVGCAVAGIRALPVRCSGAE